MHPRPLVIIDMAGVLIDGGTREPRPGLTGFLSMIERKADLVLWTARKKVKQDARGKRQPSKQGSARLAAIERVHTFGPSLKAVLYGEDCIDSGLNVPNLPYKKPLALKDAALVWQRLGRDLPLGTTFSTLVIDDAPLKWALNPGVLALYPEEWTKGAGGDGLAPEGWIYKAVERALDAYLRTEQPGMAGPDMVTSAFRTLAAGGTEWQCLPLDEAVRALGGLRAIKEASGR